MCAAFSVLAMMLGYFVHRVLFYAMVFCSFGSDYLFSLQDNMIFCDHLCYQYSVPMGLSTFYFLLMRSFW